MKNIWHLTFEYAALFFFYEEIPLLWQYLFLALPALRYLPSSLSLFHCPWITENIHQFMIPQVSGTLWRLKQARGWHVIPDNNVYHYNGISPQNKFKVRVPPPKDWGWGYHFDIICWKITSKGSLDRDYIVARVYSFVVKTDERRIPLIGKVKAWRP